MSQIEANRVTDRLDLIRDTAPLEAWPTDTRETIFLTGANFALMYNL